MRLSPEMHDEPAVESLKSSSRGAEMQAAKSQAACAIAGASLAADSTAHARSRLPIAARDAVTDGVDFVIDRDFTGVRVEPRAGTSGESKGGVQ
jgi:hypothetical protein